MTDEIIITEHAEKRLKERCGLNKKSMKRAVEKAYRTGIRHGDTKGCLKKWIDSLYFVNRKANNVRLYGDKAYIFTNNLLITVFQIPNNLRAEMKSLTKTNEKSQKGKAIL